MYEIDFSSHCVRLLSLHGLGESVEQTGSFIRVDGVLLRVSRLSIVEDVANVRRNEKHKRKTRDYWFNAS